MAGPTFSFVLSPVFNHLFQTCILLFPSPYEVEREPLGTKTVRDVFIHSFIIYLREPSLLQAYSVDGWMISE
jgi:hypothetical protein